MLSNHDEPRENILPFTPRTRPARTACVAFIYASLFLANASGQPSILPNTFEAGAWEFTFGGYVKLDVIHDFDAIGSADLFDPRTIPVEGIDGSDTRVNARESRLFFGMTETVDEHDLKLYFEGDFYGPGGTFRLRQAYGQYGGFLAGQTWSTFMDETNIPPTIDFESPLAAPLVRQGLVRWTMAPRKGEEISVALEESDPVVVPAPGITGTSQNPWPDVTARIRFTEDWGHLQVSAFVGQTDFKPDVGREQKVTIGGILVSTRVHLFDKDSAYFEVAAGPGVGRYRGSASAAFDESGNLKAINVLAFTLGYERYWSARWSSNFVVSPASVHSEPGDPAATNRRFIYAAVNVRDWFIEQRAWVGLELLRGTRELRNGDESSANRLQVAVRFNF